MRGKLQIYRPKTLLVLVYSLVIFLWGEILIKLQIIEEEMQTDITAVVSGLKFERNQGTLKGQLRPRVICGCSGKRSGYVYVLPTLSNSGRLKELTTLYRPLLQNSTCSPEATEAGNSQNVVSFSYYTEVVNQSNYYLEHIQGNLDRIREFYPGWLVRLYSNLSLSPGLCNLLCNNEDLLFFCPIEFISQFDMGDVSEEDPKQWRFLPLGDPTVHKFLVRDLDSRVSQREADAVRVWEHSGKAFHAMRDHPMHMASIMGGMWGGDNWILGGKARSVQRRIVNNRWSGCCGVDQAALHYFVYEKFQGSILFHDSYFCEYLNETQPFPTKREDPREFVGKTFDPFSTFILPACPKDCRPDYGQDWTYC